MENNGKIKEIKISKLRMSFKMMRLFMWTIIKRKWYLPNLGEITVDELFDLINSNQSPLIIDLRAAEEFYGNGQNAYMTVYGHIPNAKRMGITELSSNLEDLQSFKEKLIVTLCPGGGMSLVAVDIFITAGFQDVKSLKGGMNAWHKKGYPIQHQAEDTISPHEDIKPSAIEDSDKIIEGKKPLDEKSLSEVHFTLDARNLSCPIPILKSKKKLKTMKIGQVLEILTTDRGSFRDIPAWAHFTGQELLVSEERGSKGFRFLVKRMK